MSGKPSVLLLGAGAMGGALMRGWLRCGTIDAARSAAIDPNIAGDIIETWAASGLKINPPADDLAPDVLVIAVKPQIAAEALSPYRAIASSALVVSIMAGKSCDAIRRALPGVARLVRAMPNLPSSLGVGASGLYADGALTTTDRDTAARLLDAVGAVVWVARETDIDIVTALSGSGPAYFFAFAEALAKAARDAGLGDDAATLLARQTLIGAGALAGDDRRPLAALRRSVTSPGGTTAAALDALSADDRLQRLASSAIDAAVCRAAELSD